MLYLRKYFKIIVLLIAYLLSFIKLSRCKYSKSAKMFILDLINREVAKIDIEHENFILNFLSSLMKVLRLYVVCRNDSIIIAQRYRHDRYKGNFCINSKIVIYFIRKQFFKQTIFPLKISIVNNYFKNEH